VPPSRTAVESLRSGIRERGPDGESWKDLGHVVLAHAHFATTLEAARERQPTRHVSRDVWLTADARIDNRDELRRFLANRVQHPLDTDADFILAAYEHWGEELTAHLLGDFAFAIWDGEHEHLLIVRDQIGLRPAFWCSTEDGGFVAASTVRSILEAGGLSRELDRTYLAQFPKLDGSVPERTPWSGVRRLPGGHCLLLEKGRTPRIWRYWSPPSDHLEISVEDASRHIRSIFSEATQCRLRSPSPIGIQLSGGFDSTTVAAVACEAMDRDSLLTYSLTFPGQECDETRYIAGANMHLQLKSRLLDALDADPYDFVKASQDSLGSPPFPDDQWNVPLAVLAASDGCRVVLSGQGGDHGLYADRQAIVDDFVRRGRLIAAWGALDGSRTGRWARASRLLRSGVRSSASRRPNGWIARMLATRRDAAAARREASSLAYLGPDLAPFARPDVRFPAVHGRFGASRADRRALYTDSLDYVVDLWDRTAVAGRIEYRYPFLDVRLIELLCQLGEDVIGVDGSERGLHRRAFGELLPPTTLNRTDKAYFDRPWISAGIPWARLVCEADDERLDAHLNRRLLREHTDALSVDSSADVKIWHWWTAVAIGLFVLACDPS
jgi:asparagine synthase (glutamine-hydrolysing)